MPVTQTRPTPARFEHKPAPSEIKTFTQLFHSSEAAAAADPASKYLFSAGNAEVTGYSSKRQMVGVVMTEHLAAELAALRNHPRVLEIPALRAFMGSLHRITRHSFPSQATAEVEAKAAD